MLPRSFSVLQPYHYTSVAFSVLDFSKGDLFSQVSAHSTMERALSFCLMLYSRMTLKPVEVRKYLWLLQSEIRGR
uniref:Uncharacterized protein n=1 Tax=Anguilla anguilla TaxID=7936 RepID=A0A0E9WRT8_ANGAN